MENNENTPELELEQENETVGEVDESTDSTAEAEPVDWEAEAKKYKAIANRKAKQAEKRVETQTPTQSQEKGLSEDDIIVISSVADKEKLDSLKEIAKLKNISLMEAKNSQLYKLAEQEIEETRKREAAQLGASKGSGKRPAEKSFATQGLSDEEHKALFNKAVGK